MQKPLCTQMRTHVRAHVPATPAALKRCWARRSATAMPPSRLDPDGGGRAAHERYACSGALPRGLRTARCFAYFERSPSNAEATWATALLWPASGAFAGCR